VPETPSNPPLARISVVPNVREEIGSSGRESDIRVDPINVVCPTITMDVAEAALVEVLELTVVESADYLALTSQPEPHEWAGAEQMQLVLRLDSSELGPMRIHLSSRDQTVTARVEVANESARQVLQSNLDSLRTLFVQAGLTLGECDISYQHPDAQQWKEPTGYVPLTLSIGRRRSAPSTERLGRGLVDIVA